MKIEVLGPGCAKCEKLLENAEAAVREAGVGAEVVKVTEITEFAKYGVMLTPALVIDGEVKCAGRAAGVEEIKKMIS